MLLLGQGLKGLRLLKKLSFVLLKSYIDKKKALKIKHNTLKKRDENEMYIAAEIPKTNKTEKILIINFTSGKEQKACPGWNP